MKLAFTGLAGFTLACIVIETAGTAVGKTVAGSSESQNYFVTRTVVELLLALRRPVRKTTSGSGRPGGIIYYSGSLNAAQECLASSHEAYSPERLISAQVRGRFRDGLDTYAPRLPDGGR